MTGMGYRVGQIRTRQLPTGAFIVTVVCMRMTDNSVGVVNVVHWRV